MRSIVGNLKEIEMKTLADLKRDLSVGMALTLVKAPTMPKHKFLNVKRYIVKKQGNGVYLNQDINAQSGSFLEFANAKLTEYDGKTIKTYQAGTRPLTEEEKKVLKNRPTNREENQKRLEMEMMTDTNGSWYMDRQYFNEQGMSYLFESGGTKHLNHHDNTITDEQLKGRLELSYLIN